MRIPDYSRSSDAVTVLVVEDEYHIRNLLEEGLRSEGFDVRTASTPSYALRAMEDECPDVVLLDLMLPEIDGIELARKISSKWPVSIIAMSASHSLLHDAQTMPFIDGSVSKPFEWDALVRGVHTSANQKNWS